MRGLPALLFALICTSVHAASGVTPTLRWQDTEPVPSYRIYQSAVDAADWKLLAEVEALRACTILTARMSGRCRPVLDCAYDVPDDEHDYRVCRMKAGVPIDCDAPVRPIVVCTDERGRAFPPGADIGASDGIYPGPPGGRCP